MSLLMVQGLKIFTDDKILVENIDFTIKAGEWFALIGESGSGKTLSAFSITALLPKGVQKTAEKLVFQKEDMLQKTPEQLRRLRGVEIAYVFQDYQNSFTPHFTLGNQLDEVLQVHTDWHFTIRQDKIQQALADVGLEAKTVLQCYPFQLSGGQLQRTSLALALILQPKLLIVDEPTTALDAVNATRVLDLIFQLKSRTNCAVLFITHDLRYVKRYADTIAVMKNGKIIEQGAKQTVLENPQNIYTKNLLASTLTLRNSPKRLAIFDEQLSQGVCSCGAK